MGPSATIPGISQLLVQVHSEDRDARIAYAIERGHGVEIADFIAPELLDDNARCAELAAWYRERLPQVRGLVTFHGAFWNLVPGAIDPKIAAVTRERVVQGLDLAEGLGASAIVFHMGFDALNLDPGHVEQWAERQARLWKDVMAGRSINLLFENTREPSPKVMAAALEATGAAATGVCLDLGHAYLRSLPFGPEAERLQGAPPAEWISALGPRIRYLHLSDNDRIYDQHLALGRGSIEWPALLQALESAGLRLPAAMEVAGVEGAQATEEYLRALAGGGQ